MLELTKDTCTGMRVMENSPQRYTKRMKQRSIGQSSLFRVAPWDWRMWALVHFWPSLEQTSCLKAPPALKVYGLIPWILDIAIAKCPLRTLPATSIYAQQKSLSSELLVTTVSLSGPYLLYPTPSPCRFSPQRPEQQPPAQRPPWPKGDRTVGEGFAQSAARVSTFIMEMYEMNRM